jgi:hypothetical protein
MNATEFHSTILLPNLATVSLIAPELTDTPASRLMLLAIAGQESDWTHRIQSGNGPAHSFWQMERGGGVHGVLHHSVTGPILRRATVALQVAPDEVAIWGMMASPAGDALSTLMARLLLWSDSRALPIVDDEEDAYTYYIDNWRPGRPSRSRWAGVYPEALDAVRTAESSSGTDA